MKYTNIIIYFIDLARMNRMNENSKEVAQIVIQIFANFEHKLAFL